MTNQKQHILDWYQEQAKRTCPDLGSEKLNLAHMVLGIMTERAEELDSQDITNELEELADGIWYVANYCTLRNFKLSKVFKDHDLFSSSLHLLATDDELEFYDTLEEEEFLSNIVNSQIVIGELQDLVKKFLAYNKEIDKVKEKDVLEKIGGSYWSRLDKLVADCGLDVINSTELLQHILGTNIKKLKIRFPEKFTEENALNRNLEAERKVLENN